MQTIQMVREPLGPVAPTSSIAGSVAARCNSSSSHSSSSSASSFSSSASSLTDDQQRVKQRASAGKRFLVSRVHHPQQQQQQPAAVEAPFLHERVQQRRSNEVIKVSSPSPVVATAAEEQHKAAAAAGFGGSEVDQRISFRYTWPVRISERMIGADEYAILNVSPPFCTAHNGVQFTWLLRICEENILDFGCSNGDTSLHQLGTKSNKKVNITLYYKEGPARDVQLRGGNISIRNSRGLLFDEMPLRELEYTKGGGWSPLCAGAALGLSAEQRKFSDFIHSHIGRQITVRVKLEMPAALFQPMQYLPSIESPLSDKLEALCTQVFDQIRSNQLHVPDVEYFDPTTNKYALYRHVYQFACQEIFHRFIQQQSADGQPEAECQPELMDKIRNIFAYFYFNTVIVREAECFEDFLEALDASRHVQFPALRRECERYICTEVMAESADLTLVKKMLLLAERFDLPVLKMVSFGVIIDRMLLGSNNGGGREPATAIPSRDSQMQLAGGDQKLLISSHCHHRGQRSAESGCATIESSMEEIREELLEMAEQIIHPSDHHQQNSTAAIPNCPLASDHGRQQQLAKPCRTHTKSLSSPKRLSTASSSADSSDGNFVEHSSEEENNAARSDGDDDDDDEEEEEMEPGGETLVGSVIAQLEELARHIRKVSMPPGVRPAPLQGGRPLSPQQQLQHGIELVQQQHPHDRNGADSGTGSMDSRRSSLKTGRELLLQQHRPERSNSSGESQNGTPNTGNSSSSGGGNNTFFSQLYGGKADFTGEQPEQEQQACSSNNNCLGRRNCQTGSSPIAVADSRAIQFVVVNDSTFGAKPSRKIAAVQQQQKWPVGEEDEGVVVEDEPE